MMMVMTVDPPHMESAFSRAHQTIQRKQLKTVSTLVKL